MTKYAYSLDQKRYYGSFDSAEEAAAEGLESEGEFQNVCWVGEIQEVPGYFTDGYARRIAQDVIEWLDEMVGSNGIAWDDSIIEVAPDKELELGRLILNWVRDNATFNARGVVNVKEMRR